jgi:hypothetical protein
MTSRLNAPVAMTTSGFASLAALLFSSHIVFAADPPRAASDPPRADVAQTAISAVGVERLPASAYPEPKIRGIYGGSLWSTMQGWQWPYMPSPGSPRTTIGFSGYGWVDTAYEKLTAGSATDVSQTQWIQQGRFVLRTTPTWSNRQWFVQAQAEIVANNDQTQNHPVVVDTDDLWVRFGKWNVFDVQVGRFQAWELYHFGMGLDLNTFERRGASVGNNTAPAIYGVTYTWDRPSGVGDLAAHFYLTDFLRIEALGQIGNDAGQNAVAGRPTVVLDFGWLKLKGAGEYKILNDTADGRLAETKQRGAGASVEFIVDPYVEFGLNGAQGLIDVTNEMGGIDPVNSVTTTSFGGFANARAAEDLLVGVGVNTTNQVDIHKNPMTGAADQATHLQAFGAVQYLLWKQLFIKAVVAYAKADFTPGFDTTLPPFSNKMVSGRLRFLYNF